MSYDSNVQIIFGPTDDSFLIIHGGRCSLQNMPQDLVDGLLKRSEFAPFLRVAWIRQAARPPSARVTSERAV